MTEKITKGEAHGCIVCGKLYQLLVVYDANGKYVDSKVMSADGKRVEDERRPLAACNRHSTEEIKAAVNRVYGEQKEEED